MAKRLQVILQGPEYREVQRAARARHMSIAEWVQQALKEVCRHELHYNVEKKLAAVRAAVRHESPTSDIESMLAEIEKGYLS